MRRLLTAVPVAVVVVLIGLALVFGFGDHDHLPSTVSVAEAGAHPSTRLIGDWPDPKPTHPTSYPVADAIGDTVDLFEAPEDEHEPRQVLDNPTHEGLPLLFRVLEDEGDWLRVQPSMRPNEAEAWIRSDQVARREVPNRIEIELESMMVRVFHGDDLLWETESAIGSERTPTPLGTFFVDGWVRLAGGGPYGAGQLSVAGFSDVLHSFGGGNGQIAIHGTNRPELIGSAISNGCIRIEDDKLLELVELAPLGTPVVVRESFDTEPAAPGVD